MGSYYLFTDTRCSNSTYYTTTLICLSRLYYFYFQLILTAETFENDFTSAVIDAFLLLDTN